MLTLPLAMTEGRLWNPDLAPVHDRGTTMRLTQLHKGELKPTHPHIELRRNSCPPMPASLSERAVRGRRRPEQMEAEMADRQVAARVLPPGPLPTVWRRYVWLAI